MLRKIALNFLLVLPSIVWGNPQKQNPSPAKSDEFAIRVHKVQGEAAIVQFPSYMKPKAGDVYVLSSQLCAYCSQLSSQNLSRTYSLNLSSNYTRAVQGVLGSSVAFSAAASKNYGRFEHGPAFSWNRFTVSEGAVSRLKAGWSLDLNFLSNLHEVRWVPGVSALAFVGVASGSQTLEALGTVFLKAFVFGSNPSALRLDLGSQWSREASGSSFVLYGSLGLSTYFDW